MVLCLRSFLLVCLFVFLLNLNTTKPLIHDFAFKWRGKKALIGACWFLRSGPPVYLSYNNALKALTHVDNAKVSQLAATV